MPNPNGWNEWSKFVLKDIEQRHLWEDKIEEKLEVMGKDIVRLQMKSGIWGAIAGLIPSTVVVIYFLLK